MDLPRLLSLLEESALYFAKVGKLDDPYEGVLSRPAVESLMQHASGQHNVKVLTTGARSLLFVSSWHLSEHESAAMWKVYSAAGQGIAVQSTVGAIQTALRDAEDRVMIGRVKYIDYGADPMSDYNLFTLAYCKRKSFEYEKELRLSIAHADLAAPGKPVPVDLVALIDRVYVAPRLPDWMAQLTGKVLRRYGLEVEVVHSDLDDPPLS